MRIFLPLHIFVWQIPNFWIALEQTQWGFHIQFFISYFACVLQNLRCWEIINSLIIQIVSGLTNENISIRGYKSKT